MESVLLNGQIIAIFISYFIIEQSYTLQSFKIKKLIINYIFV